MGAVEMSMKLTVLTTSMFCRSVFPGWQYRPTHYTNMPDFHSNETGQISYKMDEIFSETKKDQACQIV